MYNFLYIYQKSRTLGGRRRPGDQEYRTLGGRRRLGDQKSRTLGGRRRTKRTPPPPRRRRRTILRGLGVNLSVMNED